MKGNASCSVKSSPMPKSFQRILVRRALDGTHPKSLGEIICFLVEVARVWNQKPTPFVWGGKRKVRRKRAKLRRLGGSGAAIHPLYRPACQVTHQGESFTLAV